MNTILKDLNELNEFGHNLGRLLLGGDIIELIGDVGAGKTTLVKSIAAGMGINEAVTSPSYTLSQVYTSPSGLILEHYDFYRLNDPGILKESLLEALQDTARVCVIEWAEIVSGVLPDDHLQIRIIPEGDSARFLDISGGGARSVEIIKELQ